MNLNDLLLQLQIALNAIKANVPLALGIVLSLWIIQIINKLVGYRLNVLGIYPRSVWGLFGIIFSSFLHGGFNHLFFNSLPLFVLICFMLTAGLPKFIAISATIILLSGFAVWLFGRRAIHIGASGVVMGYWSYLLVNAYQHPSALSVVLAIICVYYFGGLFFNLFPMEEKTSWEGHVFGFLAGLAAVFLFP